MKRIIPALLLLSGCTNSLLTIPAPPPRIGGPFVQSPVVPPPSLPSRPPPSSSTSRSYPKSQSDVELIEICYELQMARSDLVDTLTRVSDEVQYNFIVGKIKKADVGLVKCKKEGIID